ncbi:MAG TPA: Ig-like domain-containing protein [Candidatus Dormibacteraeota bacterium]|nr:Ig-like domain-containing protein [Candidatus Dormibacteraeota bacterium]
MGRAATAARCLVVGSLVLPLTACFSAPPQISALVPANNAGNVAADAPVRISFDHGIDRGSVVARLHVSPPIPGCDLQAAFVARKGAPCRISWSPDGSVLTLDHRGALFAPATTYGFSLSPGVGDSKGAVNSLDHHWSFTTASAPSVRGLSTGDGVTDARVDAPIVVAFSTAMDTATTAAAISLRPDVPGTRVVANQGDHSRFVLLPGELLRPVAQYTLTVSRTATDEHGQPLDSAAVAHFTTGGLTGAPGHVLVLLRANGEAPTRVLLTALGPGQSGDPVAAATVLSAPRCGIDLCGTAQRGAPTTTFDAVALSPDGQRLAVVERDQTSAAPQPLSLHLIELASGADITVADGGHLPSWSPDSDQLAYATGDAVRIRSLDDGADFALPMGDPLVSPPVWSGDSATVALPVRDAAGIAHVDLASPQLRIRYPVPSLGGELADPVLNQDGTTLALHHKTPSGSGTWLVQLRTGDAAPRRLGADLVPLAFADSNTVVAVERPVDGNPGLVRVTVSDGNVSRLPAGPASSDLSSVAVAPAARQLAYLERDAKGVVQAVIVNADGSNPTTLTTLAPADQFDAVAVGFGG